MNINNSYDEYLWSKIPITMYGRQRLSSNWMQEKKNKSFVEKKNLSVDITMREEHVIKE